MKPRIFVSSVSRELKTVRQLVANTLVALGYEPVWQDIFDTSSDDIRPMLRKKIDSCSAVLQIVGNAYGAEPPEPDQEFGRVSYTQYELLYAKSKGKRIYYLIAEDDLPRDSNPVDIDVPRDDSDAAIADATERARLQSVYREQILTGEQVYYPVGSHSDTELSVRRLRDDLAKMRRGFRGWMIGVTAALVLIAAGIFWQMRQSQEQGEKLDDTTTAIEELKEYVVNPKQMRSQIVLTVEQTYESAVADAQNLESWRDRDDAIKLAEQQRDNNLDRVDEFLNSIVAGIESGDASPESIEFARVLEEEGAAEAIAFIAARKEQILSKALKLAKKTKESQSVSRKKLAPLLDATRLLANQGQYAAARQQCDEILAIEPSWPEALHVQVWHLFELGDLARRYDSVTAAAELYVDAEKLAKRLAFGAETHAESQRDLSVSFIKLSDVYTTLGRTEEALQQFEKRLEISQRLAQADPSDSQKQRDLMVSEYKIGNLYFGTGDLAAAKKRFAQGVEVLDRMITNKQDVEQSKREKAFLEDLIAKCEDAKEVQKGNPVEVKDSK